MVLAICFLFGMISSSQAAEITSLSADNGASGCYMSLTTDENIWVINWYVKQTYPKSEADSDYEHIHTSMHNAGTRSVYVNIGYLEGHIKIAEYDIKAEVIFENANHDNDTATTSVDAYGGIYDTGIKETGVYGSAYLLAHYFNGSAIVMDGGASAYNGTGGRDHAAVTGRFRHTAVNKDLDDIEEGFSADLKNGESASWTTSDWEETHFNFGTTLDDGEEEWECNAYVRIQVGMNGTQDDWSRTTQNTFDYRDHR